MEQRKLGTQGLTVSAIGLGCMGLTGAYGNAPDEGQAVATIHRALDLGINFLDTAEVYGPYTNEQLVGRALRGRREGVVVATKFGFKLANGVRGVDGSPENVKRAANQSLMRLGIDVIDLYYQHRRDPDVPIEETVGAMKELVEAGKVRYIGLSEVGPERLRRANAVHPISALQSEYSLWERGVENEVLPAARELGIGFVPYSPLGRGFLTGSVDVASLSQNDFRKTNPRFSEESARANEALVAVVREVAEQCGATPAQVALGWVLSRGSDVVPIPGTKRVRYVEENVGALELKLTPEQLARLDSLASKTAGERYAPEMMKLVER